MKRIATSLIAATLALASAPLLLPATAHAESPRVKVKQEQQYNMPRRGMTMDQVRREYGAPLKVLATRGGKSVDGLLAQVKSRSIKLTALKDDIIAVTSSLKGNQDMMSRLVSAFDIGRVLELLGIIDDPKTRVAANGILVKYMPDYVKGFLKYETPGKSGKFCSTIAMSSQVKFSLTRMGVKGRCLVISTSTACLSSSVTGMIRDNLSNVSSILSTCSGTTKARKFCVLMASGTPKRSMISPRPAGMRRREIRFLSDSVWNFSCSTTCR